MGRSRDLADGTLAELNVDSNTLAVDATNNRVGIGTSSPNADGRLDVVGGRIRQQYTGASAGMLFGQYDSSGTAHVTNQANAVLWFGTNNIERMRIDSSGRVTMPYQPSFCAVSTTSTNIAAGTPVIVPLGATLVNVGSHYNTSTYRFTAPIAGQYEFSLSAMMHGSAGAGSNASLRLYKNGSQLSYSHIYGAHPAAGAFTIIVTAAANDYFEFYAENIYRQTSNYITMFLGKLIG